jgi:1-deoxy-D-xylulose-5-phosphate reductoisomerase
VTTSLTLLGSTGSIGVNTLDVVRRHPDRYAVFALAANRSVELMLAQCIEFEPRYAVMQDRESAEILSQQLRKSGCPTEVLAGAAALEMVASATECSVVMAAIVGGAGLAATFAAACAGKRVLLANKESLVMAGAIFMQAVRDNGALLLPIDSEHNAIFQCLANGARGYADGVSRIWLTASGGPLLRLPLAELAKVTPEEACAHPNWKMGKKISVDSATMMNKGLELIEACWLFDTTPDNVEIVIHPQSIIHSLVTYRDGSTMAQLGNPDMRTPIAHGLAWPERIASGVASLDLVAVGGLQFEAIDHARFPCLGLARRVAGTGQANAIALNAANEIVVQAFLDELIGFADIPSIIDQVLEKTSTVEPHTIADVLLLDDVARVTTREVMARVCNVRIDS